MGDRAQSIVIGALLQDIIASCYMLLTDDEPKEIWIRDILECVKKISLDDGFCDVAPLQDACQESRLMLEKVEDKLRSS